MTRKLRTALVERFARAIYLWAAMVGLVRMRPALYRTAVAAGQAGGKKTEPGKPAAPAVPFPRASHEFVEGTFADTAITPGPGQKGGGGPYDVMARGYAAALWVLTEATGGVLGTANLLEDFPWSYYARPRFSDPAGVDYFGNGLDGFDWMLVNRYGMYAFFQDPKAGPDVVQTLNFHYALRIPIQVTSRDAFAALLNEDSAEAFQFDFGVAALSQLVDVPANLTTVPEVRTRAWLEGWVDPRPNGPQGQVQSTKPVGFGNAQYWSKQVYQVNGGFNTIKLKKTGLLVRDLILIYRDSTGARSDADFPETLTFTWDSRMLLTNIHKEHIRRWMYERMGIEDPELGVYVLDYLHDTGHGGNELRNLYLPTRTATRLEIQGVFGDSGTLTVLTNDIGAVGNPGPTTPGA